jgi:hypothetical protein
VARNGGDGKNRPQISPLRYAPVEMTKDMVVVARNGGYVKRDRRSLHRAPPDFLCRPVALMVCMRLSLRRAAHVAVASSAK